MSLKINKPKRFDKSVTNIFDNIQFLYKYLLIAITPNKNIWDSITIIVPIDS